MTFRWMAESCRRFLSWSSSPARWPFGSQT